MTLARTSLAAAALAAVMAPATADVIALNFAGLDGDNYEQPLNFYNGGLGGLGSGPGPNYGITFGADAITCSGQPGGACNSAQIPGGPGANLLFFLGGPGDIMNVAAGFDTGFAFYYSAPVYSGAVEVFSGLNGTGTLLAHLDLPLTSDGSGDPACYFTNYCPYVPVGVAFAGTAQSVNFTGVANYIAFGNVTLGATAPVPEPGTYALMALGLAGIGVATRRRRSV